MFLSTYVSRKVLMVTSHELRRRPSYCLFGVNELLELFEAGGRWSCDASVLDLSIVKHIFVDLWDHLFDWNGGQ